MECLDEDTILELVQGDLPAERRRAAEDHITTCDECRILVSAVARASLPGVKPEVDPLAMSPTEPSARRQLSESSGGGPASAPVRPGDVLADKYVVESVLGAGGMGVVVSARQTQLDRRVAVKFLLPSACEIPGAVARFLREGKAAARITSEHVARVIDTGVLGGGAPFLVMEYLDGADLAAVVAEKGALAWSDAVEYVLQAAEAIVEAHTLGVIHRDLKPANLFLTKRADGSAFVKVLDFGISKIEGGSRRDLTTASMLMGSPRYMSPEQMVSAKDVDARTDVWALGVILYELVTARPVWEADTVHGLSAQIATAPAPPVRDLVPEVPAELEAVIARCLAKRREERIASVADLAIALFPIADARARGSIERILSVAGRPAIGSAEERGRHPAALIGVGVLALLVLGIVLNVAGEKRRPGALPDTTPAAALPADVRIEPVAIREASASATPAASSAPAPKPAAVVTRKAAPAPVTTASTSAPAASSAAAPQPPPPPSNRALLDRK